MKATEICFSNIDRLFRNAINGLRGFIAVTDSKIYLIIRGKLLLNTLTLLDKTYIIPRKDVIGISMEHVKGIEDFLERYEKKAGKRSGKSGIKNFGGGV